MKLSTLSRASSVCSWFPSVGSLARSFSATVLVGDAVDEDLGRSRRPESVTVLTFVDSAVVDSTRRWWRCRRWWGGPRRRCQRSFTVTVTSFGDDVGRSRRRKRCWSEMVLEMELGMVLEMEVGDGVGAGFGGEVGRVVGRRGDPNTSILKIWARYFNIEVSRPVFGAALVSLWRARSEPE